MITTTGGTDLIGKDLIGITDLAGITDLIRIDRGTGADHLDIKKIELNCVMILRIEI
jgi:hypothetical protein